MGKNVYNCLQEQIDQYSIGYPATKSGIEIKILQKLFTEEEAKMYLNLSLQLEEPTVIAERINQSIDKVSPLLSIMAQKGLIFRHQKGERVRYAAAPFVLGIYEYQLKSMDRELAEYVDTYFEEGFVPALVDSIPLLRTIPVNKSIESDIKIESYANAREIIKNNDKIAVSDCICRIQKKHLDKNCDKPIEACFQFGSHADYYVTNGLGRYVSNEEAIEILDTCEEAGLVNQVASSANPGGMCNCCGDCCPALIALKKLPKPSEIIMNNYQAIVDSETCQGCEICVERCQMDAISMNEEDEAVIDFGKCIGCGLCVTTCPDEAINLEFKPENQRTVPPASPMELMLKVSEMRDTSLVPFSFSNN